MIWLVSTWSNLLIYIYFFTTKPSVNKDIVSFEMYLRFVDQILNYFVFTIVY